MVLYSKRELRFIEEHPSIINNWPDSIGEAIDEDMPERLILLANYFKYGPKAFYVECNSLKHCLDLAIYVKFQVRGVARNMKTSYFAIYPDNNHLTDGPRGVMISKAEFTQSLIRQFAAISPFGTPDPERGIPEDIAKEIANSIELGTNLENRLY